jgi:hypothetical protein
MGLFSRSASTTSEADGSSATGSRVYPARVLFLDDDPSRAAMFQEECPHAVWVQTAAECIEHLANPWDEVHLDHDLGGEHFVDTDRDDCGMEVVRWLCGPPRKHLKSTRFTIHSHNLIAATMMGMHMTVNGFKCDLRPFGVRQEAKPEPVVDPAPPLTGWARIRSGVRRLLGARDELDPAFYDYLANRTDTLEEEATQPRLDLDWLHASETTRTAEDETHEEAAEREFPQVPPVL